MTGETVSVWESVKPYRGSGGESEGNRSCKFKQALHINANIHHKPISSEFKHEFSKKKNPRIDGNMSAHTKWQGSVFLAHMHPEEVKYTVRHWRFNIKRKRDHNNLSVKFIAKTVRLGWTQQVRGWGFKLPHTWTRYKNWVGSLGPGGSQMSHLRMVCVPMMAIAFGAPSEREGWQGRGVSEKAAGKKLCVDSLHAGGKGGWEQNFYVASLGAS